MTTRKMLYVDYLPDEHWPLVNLSIYDPMRPGEIRKHFYVSAKKLRELPEKRYSYDKDIRSYLNASLEKSNRLRLEFTWIQAENTDGEVTGRLETIHVDWNAVKAIIDANVAPEQPYKLLDLGPVTARPKITFVSTKNLHDAIGTPLLRHRVAKAFMENFNYPGADEIRIYDDFQQHSFYFEEFTDGKRGICGGLILHQTNNREQMKYSIHT